MASAGQKHLSVCGLGWGDEGKGKIVDLICPACDLVVRHNGGANAGHTVCVGDEKFALHLLPTGVLHERIEGVIGPGVVCDPNQLIDELDALAERGVEAASRLLISDRAHLVLAYHKIEDQMGESTRGKAKIGTTARGIGPCYADKMRRTPAVRFSDLVSEEGLEDRVRRIAADKAKMFDAVFGTDGGMDVDAIVADLIRARDRLGPMVCDTTHHLHQAIDNGKSILFEGANGLLLDIDHGTYPFVTSSNTGPHGIGGGAGVFPSDVPIRIGVLKAYSTRVGSGPFVTELNDDVGDRIRKQGNEFGTTTGRPRRCGWFDVVTSRYSARLAGTTDLALMHLDTLSGLDEVGICTGYRLDGKTISVPPADARQLDRCEPVVEFLPGWHENIRPVRRIEDLPQTARDYVERIESLVGVAVSLIGTGPDRSQVLVRGALAEIVTVPEPSNA